MFYFLVPKVAMAIVSHTTIYERSASIRVLHFPVIRWISRSNINIFTRFHIRLANDWTSSFFLLIRNRLIVLLLVAISIRRSLFLSKVSVRFVI